MWTFLVSCSRNIDHLLCVRHFISYIHISNILHMYVITYVEMQIKQSPLNVFQNRENNIAPKSHKDTKLKMKFYWQQDWGALRIYHFFAGLVCNRILETQIRNFATSVTVITKKDIGRVLGSILGVGGREEWE